MAEDKSRETKLSSEERTRATPETGAEAQADKRDRTGELPATQTKGQNLQKRVEAANETANQTIDEGNKNEVEGKLAVPRVEVMKRGQTKYTDKDGNLVKKVNSAEVNAALEDEELPDYLKLHQEVLDGRDPIEATLEYQDHNPDEAFAEGKLANAEEHPRTGGIGVAAATPENQQRAGRERE